MAITLVNVAAAGSTDGDDVTSGAVMTGANLFVACVSYLQGGAPSQVSDSVNGTTGWTKHDDVVLGGSVGLQLWSNDGVTGASQTFTATSVNGQPAMVVFGFSGADDPAFEATTDNSTQTSVTTISPGSRTPSEDNEVIVTGMSHGVGTGNTIDGSFSAPEEIGTVGGQHVGICASYWIQTSLAAAGPTWTINGTSDAASIIAKFQSGVGGEPGPVIPKNSFNYMRVQY